MKYMQPLNFITNYYGEQMGFYIAFILFYTSWLLPIAIAGIALFIFQMAQLKYQKETNSDTISVDNPFNCLYCIILAVWSTVFIEVWKRREFEIALVWNMNDFKFDDQERREFKADFFIDHELKQISKKNVIDTYMRRLGGEFPVVLSFIGIVIGCFIGYYIFQRDD